MYNRLYFIQYRQTATTKIVRSVIFIKYNIVKITPVISQKIIEPILVKTSTIEIFQQEQKMNAWTDILVESEHQGSVLSITTYLFIIQSQEQIITPSTHETMNTRALYIQHLLVIHWLCIDDITGSLE